MEDSSPIVSDEDGYDLLGYAEGIVSNSVDKYLAGLGKMSLTSFPNPMQAGPCVLVKRLSLESSNKLMLPSWRAVGGAHNWAPAMSLLFSMPAEKTTTKLLLLLLSCSNHICRSCPLSWQMQCLFMHMPICSAQPKDQPREIASCFVPWFALLYSEVQYIGIIHAMPDTT